LCLWDKPQTLAKSPEAWLHSLETCSSRPYSTFALVLIFTISRKSKG
jgi:hypothetical protein